jgi:RimJ/RimL family protein N-acetyltransferase
MNREQSMDVNLRSWSEDDLALLERLMGDPAMTVHLGGPESAEQIQKRHKTYSQIEHTGKGRMFVIVAGAEQIAVGSVGYWEIEHEGESVWETGWSILPEFQGKGIATQATALAVEKARAEGKHRFIHAFPSVENHASNAICRKVGFTLQGEIDFEYWRLPGKFMRCNNWRFDLLADHSENSAVP